MNPIRSSCAIALFLFAVCARAEEVLGDPSFALTTSIDNVVPWTSQPDGIWSDPNQVQHPGTIVFGDTCRVSPCAGMRALSFSIDGAYDCATEAGDDKPGCREGIRQNFAAIDSRRIGRISLFARRGGTAAAGWGMIIGVFGDPADEAACAAIVVTASSMDWHEITVTGGTLDLLSDVCFDTLGTYDLTGLSLTKAGRAGQTVFVDDVSVDVITVVGFEPPLADLVAEGRKPPLPERAFQRGRTLPLRLSHASPSTPRLAALEHTDGPVALEVVDVSTGEAHDEGMEFRPTKEGGWIYNLSTALLEAGTYLVTIEIDDQRYVSRFVLR